MPRGDKTGPNGNGSKTGRALGYCSENNAAEFETINSNLEQRNGFGRRNRFNKNNNHGNGLGFGFRRGNNYNIRQNSFAEIKEETLIKNEINILKDQLESLEKKLKTLKER